MALFSAFLAVSFFLVCEGNLKRRQAGGREGADGLTGSERDSRVTLAATGRQEWGRICFY